MRIVNQTSEGHIELIGSLNLSTLMAFKDAVEEGLPNQPNIVIDLSKVEFEGSAILALLVLVVRRVKNNGGTVSFKGATRRLTEMAQLAGLSELFGLEV